MSEEPDIIYHTFLGSSFPIETVTGRYNRYRRELAEQMIYSSVRLKVLLGKIDEASKKESHE